MPLPIYSDETNSHALSSISSIVAVAAGKGGVGKSCVTVNLALCLAKKGYTVGIMDTDLYGPSVVHMLPEGQLPTLKENKIQPARYENISVISMAHFRSKQEAAVIRAPIANSLISQFMHGVEWGSLDFLLIDFPPGTGDIQITLAQQAFLSGAVIVTTPQEIALLDVRKAISLFEQVKIPIIGIVENMSFYQLENQEEKIYIFGQGGGERLAKEYELPFLGQIPIDPLIGKCSDEGCSLFSLDPAMQKLSTKSFCQIADQMIINLQQLNNSIEKESINTKVIWKNN